MKYGKKDKRLIYIVAEKVADNRVPEQTGVQIIMDNWNAKPAPSEAQLTATLTYVVGELIELRKAVAMPRQEVQTQQSCVKVLERLKNLAAFEPLVY